uniref:Uncharacterized protein n=1 Tax=Meloidogyne incognita TaxID=6306 RepID=A0A914KTX8_MELIC
MHSGLNTMPMNQPGNPSSSIGPWNHPFDQNEQTPFNWDQWFQQNPYHGQWPNHLGYGYHNQQNTLVQQNPSGQQSILDWMNNPSSSTTHDEHYRGPQNLHLIQSGQGQDTTLGYPLHHPWYTPYRHPHYSHQVQSDQSQNTTSDDHFNDPVNPPPSFQDPFNQQNPWDWNRFQ